MTMPGANECCVDRIVIPEVRDLYLLCKEDNILSVMLWLSNTAEPPDLWFLGHHQSDDVLFLISSIETVNVENRPQLLGFRIESY
jgi:hypothetical protein